MQSAWYDKEITMQVYLVGGAVRDALLGLPTHDKDWVVVGASPEDLLSQGYLPVGQDFPVFLHPTSHEEYALARTERKTAAGYKGFSINANADVTLEEDLLRRDLTINAMAQDDDGQIIDPFHGQQDLRLGILRHVSMAFAEDPVRILRIARFAARYGFRIAPETMQLMIKMVDCGEVDALVAERVWQELRKGLMEKHPGQMIAVLYACGALAKILPEVAALFGVPQRADYHPEIDCGIHTLLVLDQAAALNLSLEERYAALLHDLGKALTPKDVLPKHFGHDYLGIEPVKAVNERLKIPKNAARLAELATEFHILIHQGFTLKMKTVLKVLSACDAFRQANRFLALLNVCQADAQGRLHSPNTPYPQKDYWAFMLHAATHIDTQACVKAATSPKEIPNAIAHARLRALKQAKCEWEQQHDIH